MQHQQQPMPQYQPTGQPSPPTASQQSKCSCCYLPYKCLQVWVWIVLLISIACGIIFLIGGAVVISFMKIADLGAYASLITGIGAVMIILGVLMMAAGVLGIIGICTGKSWPLFLINLMLAIGIFVFIVLGIAIFVTDAFYINNLDVFCYKDWVQALDAKIFIGFSKYLCRSNCPCYENPPGHIIQKWDPYHRDDRFGWQTTLTDTTKINIQHCTASSLEPTELDTIKSIADVFSIFENKYRCSGLCTPLPYYLFTNVNNLEPIRECGWYFIDLFNNYVGILGGILFAFAGIFILCFIGTICLCNHPEHKKDQPLSNIWKRAPQAQGLPTGQGAPYQPPGPQPPPL